MTDGRVARLILEGLAFQLASLPADIWEHGALGGTSVPVVAGMRAAHDALLQHMTENDVTTLKDQFTSDIETGLRQLDNERKPG